MMNFIKKLLMKIRRVEDLSEFADKLRIKQWWRDYNYGR